MNTEEKEKYLQEHKDTDLDAYTEHLKRYEVEKRYINKLDINYFKECVQKAVDELMIESDLLAVYKLEQLEVMKTQVYGLRDLFWLFAADDISEIAGPVIRAIKKLQEKGEGEEN